MSTECEEQITGMEAYGAELQEDLKTLHVLFWRLVIHIQTFYKSFITVMYDLSTEWHYKMYLLLWVVVKNV